MAESECNGRVILEWPSSSGLAESECDGRVRMVWPSTSDVAESSWPSSTGYPKHPGRVRLAGRMNFSRVTFNRVNLAESEWSGRMTEYDWLAE